MENNTESKVVTIRLDKKLRFLLELAARSRRLTISAYIQWILKDLLEKNDN